MTEETAKALIEAIDRLVAALGRGNTVNHFHHQVQPTYQQPTFIPYTPPYWTNSGTGGTSQ